MRIPPGQVLANLNQFAKIKFRVDVAAHQDKWLIAKQMESLHHATECLEGTDFG